MLYDDFEPYQGVDGELVSVFVTEAASDLVRNLKFGSMYFRVDPDGTLYWRDGPRSEEGLDVSNRHPCTTLLGKTLDHAWLTMNRQGYIDGALLSFGSMRPEITLNVAASSIRVSTLRAWHDAAQA